VGVDPQSRNHIFESVQRLNRERGMSVVYTSHYMEEVETLCNRAAIVDEGRIIALDTIKNLIALLGGGVVYVGISRIDDAMLAQIGSLPAVKEAMLVPQPPAPPAPEGKESTVEAKPVVASPVIKIVAEQNQQAVVNVLGYMNDHDITITSLEIMQPNLESVFLHLTGKKLRE
jgi:ABC-2 type transport system ATP-binding protein